MNEDQVEDKNKDEVEDKNHWLCVATGWTIAAVLYTGLGFWRGKPHTPGVDFSWGMSAYWWGVALWERHKARRRPRQ